MIVTRDQFKITIEFDQPWERETVTYLIQTYGTGFLKRHLEKFLYQKQRAMKFVAISKQVG